MYYQGSGGILARAISKDEAKAELERIHWSTCTDNDISLYRHEQRQRFYWPNLTKDAADIQQFYPRCQEIVDINEALFIQKEGEKQSYLDYLQRQFLPPNHTDVVKVRKKSSRFFVDEGILLRRGFNQAPLKCVAGEEIATIFQEVHSRVW